jgi:ankyrin repeat protein
LFDGSALSIDFDPWLHRELGFAAHATNATDADTRLLTAVDQGDVAGVEAAIAQGADPDVRDHDGTTPLVKAIRSYAADGEIARLLLHHGADVNQEAPDTGETPLLIAEDRPAAFIRFLVDRGANIDAKTHENVSLLHFAAFRGEHDKVTILIEADADLNAGVEQLKGNTVLTCALRGGARDRTADGRYRLTAGHRKVVELLVTNGSDLEERDQLGLTPLMVSVQYGYTDVVELLLEHGADVNARTSGGFSVVSIAESYGFDDIAELIYLGSVAGHSISAF